MKQKLELKNKIVFKEKIKVKLIEQLHPCWVAWKYLIDVIFLKWEEEIHKEYFCSIIKKELNKQQNIETIHLFLTHLDEDEIEKYFIQKKNSL